MLDKELLACFIFGLVWFIVGNIMINTGPISGVILLILLIKG